MGGNIGIDLRQIRLEVVEWFYLAQDRAHWQALVDTVLNLRVPEEAGNFLTS